MTHPRLCSDPLLGMCSTAASFKTTLARPKHTTTTNTSYSFRPSKITCSFTSTAKSLADTTNCRPPHAVKSLQPSPLFIAACCSRGTLLLDHVASHLERRRLHIKRIFTSAATTGCYARPPAPTLLAVVTVETTPGTTPSYCESVYSEYCRNTSERALHHRPASQEASPTTDADL
jgi:hypothetical protein